MSFNKVLDPLVVKVCDELPPIAKAKEGEIYCSSKDTTSISVCVDSSWTKIDTTCYDTIVPYNPTPDLKDITCPYCGGHQIHIKYDRYAQCPYCDSMFYF